MKLELKENMYIRTKDGYISQYKYYDTTNMGKLLCIPLNNKTFANIEDIVKASYNIIDILKEGDYVNGLYIISIDKEEGTVICYTSTFFEEDIMTIITHEQMKQMAYKVEK